MKIDFKKLIFYYLIISVLTLLVLLPDIVFFIKNDVVNYAVSGFLIVQALLFIPVAIFSRRLKIYYWILAIIVGLTPIMLFSVFYMNIQVNAEMIGLVMDTSISEVTELLGWKIPLVIIAMVFFSWGFLKISSYLPDKISWKHGIIVSLIGIFAFGMLPFIRTRKLEYYYTVIRNTYRTFYPFRLGTTFSLIYSEMGNMKRYKQDTRNFSYHAVNTDTTDSSRKIIVMVIGEASRGDHWAINGYKRNTSPGISSLSNLVSFKHVSSGGTMTILSVPQLITRATPENYKLHTREKSILAAYKEAGFYTAWISNQSHYGLTGSIGMHFTDGDTAIYSGHGENETNFTGQYDETIFPILNNVIDTHPDKNIFIILHLIGSHWRYILRYPPNFQKFEPTSDRNHTLVTRPSKDRIINEYDNSILYTDHILTTLAGILSKADGENGFLYVSDHGENLDDNNDGLYFHSYKPTKATATVPIFTWFNDRYMAKNGEVFNSLKSNEEKMVNSAVNVFYTLIDMGKLNITGFDSTASLTRPSFISPPQNILGDQGKIYYYRDLK